MLQLKQNSTKLLQDIKCKFTEPGDVVLDACYVTIATGRPFLLLPQRHQFEGCDRDQSCVPE